MVCKHAYPLNKPEFIYLDLYFKITKCHCALCCGKRRTTTSLNSTNGGCGSLYLLVGSGVKWTSTKPFTWVSLNLKWLTDFYEKSTGKTKTKIKLHFEEASSVPVVFSLQYTLKPFSRFHRKGLNLLPD